MTEREGTTYYVKWINAEEELLTLKKGIKALIDASLDGIVWVLDLRTILAENAFQSKTE